MKKTRSKFLKIVDEKHDINFHWPYAGTDCYVNGIFTCEKSMVNENGLANSLLGIQIGYQSVKIWYDNLVIFKFYRLAYDG